MGRPGSLAGSPAGAVDAVVELSGAQRGEVLRRERY